MSAGRTILAKRGAKWLADAGVLYLSSLYRDHPTARTLNCCVPFREEQAEAYKLVDEKPKTFVLDFETTRNWHRATSLCYKLPRLHGFFGVPPPDSWKSCPAVFRQ